MFFPEGLWLGIPVVVGYWMYRYPVWVAKHKDRVNRREMKESVRAVIKMHDANQTVKR